MTADTLEALAAEAAIGRVLAAYARGVDRGDMELVASCYHPDATEDRGRFKGSLAEFLEWMETTVAGLDATWHLVGLPLIELDGDDAADVETYCLGWHRLAAGGDRPAAERTIPCRYLDRFERRDGEWRIARRTVAYETDPDRRPGEE